jgi:hypothetical protein
VFSGVFFKCFIRMFRVFQLFRTYVASVSSGCFKSRSYVAASVSDACFMCIICLQIYVAKVDRMLHLCLRFSAASPSPRCLFLLPAPARHSPPLPPLLDAGIATCYSFVGHVRARDKWRGHERGLPSGVSSGAGPA